MDTARFDQFARGLTAGTSRRGVVRNLTGAALGGILAAAGTSETEARKKKRGKRKKRQSQCTTCDQGCPAATENNPTKTVVFRPASDPNYCLVTVNLTGFAGCAEYTAEYWSAINPGGSRAQSYGPRTLGPTDLAGSSQTDLGIFAKGGYLDIRLTGAAPDFQWGVDC